MFNRVLSKYPFDGKSGILVNPDNPYYVKKGAFLKWKPNKNRGIYIRRSTHQYCKTCGECSPEYRGNYCVYCGSKSNFSYDIGLPIYCENKRNIDAARAIQNLFYGRYIKK